MRYLLFVLSQRLSLSLDLFSTPLVHFTVEWALLFIPIALLVLFTFRSDLELALSPWRPQVVLRKHTGQSFIVIGFKGQKDFQRLNAWLNSVLLEKDQGVVSLRFNEKSLIIIQPNNSKSQGRTYFLYYQQALSEPVYLYHRPLKKGDLLSLLLKIAPYYKNRQGSFAIDKMHWFLTQKTPQSLTQYDFELTS